MTCIFPSETMDKAEEGGSLYIMPDGRIVALSESAIDMISEMGEEQEGREEEEEFARRLGDDQEEKPEMVRMGMVEDVVGQMGAEEDRRMVLENDGQIRMHKDSLTRMENDGRMRIEDESQMGIQSDNQVRIENDGRMEGSRLNIENNGQMRIENNSQMRIENDLLASDSSDFDAFVETITIYKCKNCDFSSQNKERIVGHVKENHLYIKAIQEAKVLVSDGPDPIGEDEEDVHPEQSVNGIRIIVNDQVESDDILPDDMLRQSDFSIIMQKGLFDSAEEDQKQDGRSSVVTVLKMQQEEETVKNPIKTETLRKLQALEFEVDHHLRRLHCTFKGCNYVFKQQENLCYHLSCHQESGGFQCAEPGCEGRADKWRDLATHLWKQHCRDCDMLLCGVCGNYRTMFPKMLEAHNQTHQNLKQFKCDICSKGFNQMSQLKNHAVIHLDKFSEYAPIPTWAKPKQCDICQKMFSDSKSLKKHVQAIHSKLKPYICQVCGHQSARKAMLQLHVRQHTGEKPFCCGECDYRTGDHNSLRRHKRKHTGDRPYKCLYCQYSSIQSSSFKSHLR